MTFIVPKWLIKPWQEVLCFYVFISRWNFCTLGKNTSLTLKWKICLAFLTYKTGEIILCLRLTWTPRHESVVEVLDSCLRGAPSLSSQRAAGPSDKLCLFFQETHWPPSTRAAGQMQESHFKGLARLDLEIQKEII